MKTYIQKCKDGVLIFNKESLDNFINYWNTSDETRNITLHDAIGISKEEYSKNVNDLLKFLHIKF